MPFQSVVTLLSFKVTGLNSDVQHPVFIALLESSDMLTNMPNEVFGISLKQTVITLIVSFFVSMTYRFFLYLSLPVASFISLWRFIFISCIFLVAGGICFGLIPQK